MYAIREMVPDDQPAAERCDAIRALVPTPALADVGGGMPPPASFVDAVSPPSSRALPPVLVRHPAERTL